MCYATALGYHAAEVLATYLDVFTHHYLQAKNQQRLDLEDAAHLRLSDLSTQRQSGVLRATL